jgi:exodeoxyribonuclease VII large subunit
MAEKLSLTELQNIIRDSLYLTLPDMYWIVAEISEVKENYAGHCYLELIEKHPDEKNVRARVRATIWSNRYHFLKSLFTNITGETLSEGMKILIKAKVEYHEIYGLTLNISDIDPSFTMGEMALKKQMVIRKLEEEGVFNMNRELDFPVIPQRIAIISSKNAAGYTDFTDHLRNNSYGFIFYTALFEAAMQGSETENSILDALDRVAGHQDLFDVVAIIRGGGSQSDLSWFDSYKIAYYITQFPVPVITGIGHEKDISVTDMVAFQSFKTPTATADFLIECTAEADSRITELRDSIGELSRKIIDENRYRLETDRLKLVPVSRLLLADLREELNSGIIELISYGKGFIAKAGFLPANHTSRLAAAAGSFRSAKTSLTAMLLQNMKNLTSRRLENAVIQTINLEKGLNAVDPENVLKRGYTITSFKGKIIKDPDMVGNDDIIETVFSQGSLKSKVVEKNMKIASPALRDRNDGELK